AVVIAGLGGVACSIMIYQCTHRSFWNGAATSLKFLLTTLLLGTAATLLTSMVGTAVSDSLTFQEVMTEYGSTLFKCLIAVAAAKLAFELGFLRHLRDKTNTPSKRSALLMTGELARVTRARLGFGFAGGVLFPGMLSLAHSGSGLGELFLVGIAVLFAA